MPRPQSPAGGAGEGRAPDPRPQLPRAGRLRVEVVEEVGVHRGPSSAVPSSRPIEEKWFGLSRYPPWSCRVQDPALPLQKPRNGLGATPQIRECGVGVYPNATPGGPTRRAVVVGGWSGPTENLVKQPSRSHLTIGIEWALDMDAGSLA